jgi:phosphopantetheinyl transferase
MASLLIEPASPLGPLASGPPLLSHQWNAPITSWASSDALVCRRLDALPCEPRALADLVLSYQERDYWVNMRAVDKRRHEWLLGRCAAKDAVSLLLEKPLGARLPHAEIEIVPDPYGRPRAEGAWSVTLGTQPVISIAHSHGTAVALAALHPGQLVGIDLESLSHRREDYEAIAFSPDERNLLDAIPCDLRQEWALRMWCAKEALGKALGRGLSAGLLAFHIAGAEASTGLLHLDLRSGALAQFPRLRGRSLTVYTARESDFVFAAVIYQQGAAE